MSLRIFILATVFTSTSFASEWKIDFSRRYKPAEKVELHVPSAPPQKSKSLTEGPVQFVKDVFLENEPAPEIVILNTEKGFIPSSISLQEGQAYRIHVVNVNEAQKNISFVMEDFKQHHATYYGQIRSFVIRPGKSGIFRFTSPETASLGQLVVAPKKAETDLRLPASE